jgi:hypothetical protein
MYAFLDNTSLFYSSLFYSCSFVDVVFVDLSDACLQPSAMQRILTRFLFVFVQAVSPSRQCNYALPSHPTLLFSFRVQRASATQRILTRFLFVFVQAVSPSRQCNYALPSHPTLLFSFRVQRASAMKLLTFLVCMCIVVHRRLLSTVMIGRKFPNRSLFLLLIYSPHPSGTY